MQPQPEAHRLYTYEEAVNLYKQRRRMKLHNVMESIIDYLYGINIRQKIIGLMILIFLITTSLMIKNPIALIFLTPICIGLILTKEDVM
jgi:hypothetical protein